MSTPNNLNEVWKFLEFVFPLTYTHLTNMTTLRGYSPDHVFHDNPPKMVYVPEGNNPSPSSFPDYPFLFQDNGFFLLAGRFVVPVILPDDSIVALVGWKPAQRGTSTMKYVTASIPGFKKPFTLFGIETAIPKLFQPSSVNRGSLLSKSRSILDTPLSELERTDTPLFLVEGIFDQLSLNALGYAAVALQGRTCSREQRTQLDRLSSRVLAIPDRDSPQVYKQNLWNLREGQDSYITWSDLHVKDIDSLLAKYPNVLDQLDHHNKDFVQFLNF